MNKIKSLCKKVVSRVVEVDKLEIEKMIEKASYVSFDVFDTLINRNVVCPEDVFIYIDELIKSNPTIQFDDFVRKRIYAEQKTRKEIYDREFTLEDIYERLSLDTDQRDILMQIECQAEIELSTVNLEIKPLYDFCVEKKKSIYFLSDMYLPTETIERILKKNDYNIGKLFVSSQSGYTKRSGKLFEYVRDREGMYFEDWIHLGDAFYGDYLIPHRLGINAFLISGNRHAGTYINERLYRKDYNYRMLIHFIDVHIGRYTQLYERIGYAVLGPLLYGFSMWLKTQVPEDETIVFLAREGALLKCAFEIISEREAKYLCVSRHSLNCVRVDYTQNINDILQDTLDPSYQYHYEMAVLAKMYGLTDEDMETAFEDIGLKKEGLILNPAMRKRFMNAIWPYAKKRAQGQYNLFQNYLNQLGLSGKCAIVDVGWNGTMQAMLTKLGLCSDSETILWEGYYFGIGSRGHNPPFASLNKKAYLFNGDGDDAKIMENVINTVQCFEFLFLSTEGSTVRYTHTPNGVLPVLKKSENNIIVNQMIRALQEAGLDFIRDLQEAHITLEMPPIIAAANYGTMVRVPSSATLKFFQAIRCYDEKSKKMVGGEALWKYILHPKKFIYDFSQTPNKTWFLKNVFKLPLPYMAMTNFIRRIIDNKKMKYI